MKATAEFMNDLTGGSEYRSGWGTLAEGRCIYQFLMGGVGAFLDDSSDTVAKMISGEPDLLPKDIPIVRTFAPMAGSTEQGQFLRKPC